MSIDLEMSAATAGGNCHFVVASRAARYANVMYDRHLLQVPIRIAQFSLLRQLTLSDAMTMKEAPVRVGLSRSSFRAHLQPLLQDGSVTASADPSDRRATLLRITAAGRAKLAVAMPFWLAAQAEFEREFGSPETERLNQGLTRLTQIKP